MRARALVLVLAGAGVARCTSGRATGAQCAYDGECAGALVCAGGFCRAACRTDRDCAAGARCYAGADPSRAVCVPPGAPPPCRGPADCMRGEVCARDGACHAECRATRDCAVRAPYLPGAQCRGGLCVPLGTDGGTVPSGAARPIAPLPTSRVTVPTPTLRWRYGASADGATVTLCRDRLMTAGCVASGPTTQASFAPAAALSRGVWYWRLAWQAGGVPTGTSGPVWQFTVPARAVASARDASWGSQSDIDGDGFADAVVGAPGEDGDLGRVYVFRGSASGVQTTPDAPLMPPVGASRTFGTVVAGAGDMDGDGFADVAVAAGSLPSVGPMYLYLGGPSGLTAPPRAMPRPAGASELFAQIVPGGDLDGDGFADLAATTHDVTAPTAPNRVWVLYGAPGGARGPWTEIAAAGVPADRFGHTIASAGDMNGDGFADLAVSAPNAAIAEGSVYLFFGSAAGVPATPSLTLVGPDGGGADFGWSIVNVGDVNGDGFADLAVASDNNNGGTGLVSVYFGGAPAPDSSRDVTVRGPDGAGAFFGEVLGGAGDLDGNGYSDLAVRSRPIGQPPRVHVYLANPFGFTATPLPPLVDPDVTDASFGAPLAMNCDLDRDGADELLVGAPQAYAGQGRTFVYGMHVGDAAASVRAALVSPSGGPASLGAAVALLRRPARPAGVCRSPRGARRPRETAPSPRLPIAHRE